MFASLGEKGAITFFNASFKAAGMTLYRSHHLFRIILPGSPVYCGFSVALCSRVALKITSPADMKVILKY